MIGIIKSQTKQYTDQAKALDLAVLELRLAQPKKAFFIHENRVRRASGMLTIMEAHYAIAGIKPGQAGVILKNDLEKMLKESTEALKKLKCPFEIGGYTGN